MNRFIADTIVDIIYERKLSSISQQNMSFKKGFFVSDDCMINRKIPKSSKTLITEKFLRELIGKGERKFKVPEKSIITPLARMLIEEGKIFRDG